MTKSFEKDQIKEKEVRRRKSFKYMNGIEENEESQNLL